MLLLISNQLSVNGGTVQIFDITGKLVENIPLTDYHLPITGINWHAKNRASGIYLVKIQTGNKTLTRRITLLK